MKIRRSPTPRLDALGFDHALQQRIATYIARHGNEDDTPLLDTAPCTGGQAPFRGQRA